MANKKSKKKKHKKEEKLSLGCLYEDEKERDRKQFSSSKKTHKHRHHHHHHVSTDKDEGKKRRATVSSPMKGNERRLKKTEIEDRKSKEKRSRESKGTGPVLKLTIVHEKKHVKDKSKNKNASPQISERCSSKHAATDQSSQQKEEKKKEKLLPRKHASEDLKRTYTKDGCSLEKLQERRKPMKRPLPPELHDQPKRRAVKEMSCEAKPNCHSEVPNETRKKLVGKRLKIIHSADAKSFNVKTLSDNSKEALPVVKHAQPKLKLLDDITPKKKEHVPSGNTLGVILGEKMPSSSDPIARFKIPKMSSSNKTDKFNVNSLKIPQPSLPGSSAKSKMYISQQQLQKPQEVSAHTSHKPSSPSLSHLSYTSQQVQHTDNERQVMMLENASRKKQYISSREAATTYDCDYEMQLVEELHLARSERLLKVNLAENCGELTCMDIDPPEEGASTISKKHALLIVLDTNVLLSHLEFVKKIRSHGLGGLGFPTLLIPWVVLQELDYLKSGKLSSKVEDKARPAVHYIYSCLKNQEPRLMGQSMQQASQAVCGLGVVNNDDRVLQCCLQYQDLYPEGALVLCTNDKNLCSKALLSGVKAFSKADLEIEAEGTTSTILNNFHARFAVPSPAGPSTAEPVEIEKEGLQDNRKTIMLEEQQLSEHVCLLESSLQAALSEVLEEEMKSAYGDLWTEIVYVKPPWSLEGLLKCFKKHWIAVFGIIIKRSLLSSVEMLSDCLCSGRSLERTSVLSAVSLATELLSALSGRSQYNGQVAYALSTLHTIQERLQSPKVPVGSSEADNEDSLMAEIEEGASHQEVWALFESIWNNVCQISSALFSALHYTPGTTETSLQSTSPPPQEALSCLQRLSTALKQLLEALQRLLSSGSSVQDAQSLLSFIQTSEIAAMEPRFTARDLFDCVSQQEYREKLCVGGAQLSELCVNLDQCAAAVRSWP